MTPFYSLISSLVNSQNPHDNLGEQEILAEESGLEETTTIHHLPNKQEIFNEEIARGEKVHVFFAQKEKFQGLDDKQEAHCLRQVYHKISLFVKNIFSFLSNSLRTISRVVLFRHSSHSSPKTISAAITETGKKEALSSRPEEKKDDMHSPLKTNEILTTPKVEPHQQPSNLSKSDLEGKQNDAISSPTKPKEPLSSKVEDLSQIPDSITPKSEEKNRAETIHITKPKTAAPKISVHKPSPKQENLGQKEEKLTPQCCAPSPQPCCPQSEDQPTQPLLPALNPEKKKDEVSTSKVKAAVMSYSEKQIAEIVTPFIKPAPKIPVHKPSPIPKLVELSHVLEVQPQALIAGIREKKEEEFPSPIKPVEPSHISHASSLRVLTTAIKDEKEMAFSSPIKYEEQTSITKVKTQPQPSNQTKLNSQTTKKVVSKISSTRTKIPMIIDEKEESPVKSIEPTPLTKVKAHASSSSLLSRLEGEKEVGLPSPIKEQTPTTKGDIQPQSSDQAKPSSQATKKVESKTQPTQTNMLILNDEKEESPVKSIEPTPLTKVKAHASSSNLLSRLEGKKEDALPSPVRPVELSLPSKVNPHSSSSKGLPKLREENKEEALPSPVKPIQPSHPPKVNPHSSSSSVLLTVREEKEEGLPSPTKSKKQLPITKKEVEFQSNPISSQVEISTSRKANTSLVKTRRALGLLKTSHKPISEQTDWQSAARKLISFIKNRKNFTKSEGIFRISSPLTDLEPFVKFLTSKPNAELTNTIKLKKKKRIELDDNLLACTLKHLYRQMNIFDNQLHHKFVKIGENLAIDATEGIGDLKKLIGELDSEKREDLYLFVDILKKVSEEPLAKMPPSNLAKAINDVLSIPSFDNMAEGTKLIHSIQKATEFLITHKKEIFDK
jgi:hypothetical protein